MRTFLFPSSLYMWEFDGHKYGSSEAKKPAGRDDTIIQDSVSQVRYE